MRRRSKTQNAPFYTTNILKRGRFIKIKHFEEIFENVLDKHAPKKKKITKVIKKAIMKRSELATMFRDRPR